MIKIEYLNDKKTYKSVLKRINKDYIKYFKTYRYVHSKYRSSNRILKIQYEINELINLYSNLIKNLKAEEKIKITYKEYVIDTNFLIEKYKYLIKLYKLLIDDLIIKYCCSDNCMIFNQLIDNNQINSNYNYDNIKNYLEIAKRDYINKDTYCIVCDMSTFNLKCGDVLMYSFKTGFNYKEIKTGEHCQNIFNIVLENRIEELTGTNYEEAIRLKKQLSKHNDLDAILGLPLTEDGFRFPEDFESKGSYFKMIKKDFKKINKIKYIERSADDCVKYLIVNNKLADERMNNKLNEYKCNGNDIFTYNEFIYDSSIHRPYLLKWSKKEYIDLIMGNIIIYIKIDSIKIINKLSKKILGLYFEKATKEDYKNKTALIIKGKKIIIPNDKGQEFVLGKMIFYRIAAFFYKSSYAIKKFVYYNSIIKYEESNE